MIHQRVKLNRTQSGAALLISMILLIAITVLGLSNLTLVNTNEIISSNMHQKSIGFQASESAIKSVWVTNKLLDNTPVVPLINPPATTLLLNSEYDQAKVDLNASVSIQFCGENGTVTGINLSADESAPQFAAQIFDVNGIASITNSNMNSHNMQKGYIIRPKSGRLGNCPVSTSAI